MEFIQLNRIPAGGIPLQDAYCFGIKIRRLYNSNSHIYKFREHELSNKNCMGWNIFPANKTTFKLTLIF